MSLQWETPESNTMESPCLFEGDTRNSVHHFDDEANVALISSDGVRFQVWDYELRAGSEIFRNCLSIGEKGNDRVATLRLVEHSGIIRTILDALLLPVNKLEAIPQYWTFGDAAADYAAAEKYMLDRYMSVFQRRIEKAVQIGPFEALVWAVSKSDARVAKLAIEQFAQKSHLEIRAGSVRTEVKPGHWTTAMIESIGVENYRQLVRLSMDCITASIQTGRLRIDWLAVAEKFEMHTGRPGIEWECLTPVSYASMKSS